MWYRKPRNTAFERPPGLSPEIERGSRRLSRVNRRHFLLGSTCTLSSRRLTAQEYKTYSRSVLLKKQRDRNSTNASEDTNPSATTILNPTHDCCASATTGHYCKKMVRLFIHETAAPLTCSSAKASLSSDVCVATNLVRAPPFPASFKDDRPSESPPFTRSSRPSL